MTRADARAVVFPMHEPDGYPGPNDSRSPRPRRRTGWSPSAGSTRACRPRRRRAAASTRARWASSCTRAPSSSAGRARRARDHRRRARAQGPVLIHAGRGIPALGENTVELSTEFPDARFILAHAAISDLAWLWHVLGDHPNVFIDTAWWNPADLIALFSLVAPSQIVWASDSPYGLPIMAAFTHARAALQAGVSDEALRSIMGGQIERLVTGADPLWVGEAPGAFEPALHPLLDRVVTHLITGMGRAFGGGTRRVDRAGAAVVRGRRGRPARRRLRRRAPTARPLPRAPRPAAPGPPVPPRGPLPDRRPHRRAHPGGAAAGTARPVTDPRSRRRLAQLAAPSCGVPSWPRNHALPSTGRPCRRRPRRFSPRRRL